MQDAKQICDRYGPLLWPTVYRILGDYAEALDCCQDVLCEAMQHTAKREVNDSYLRWLATRRALDRLRRLKRSRDRLHGEADVAESPEQAPGPAENAQYNELIEHLRRGLAQLPSQQAEAFWLRCMEDLSYAEIAERLDADANTVGVLIHRAKARLQTLLGSFASDREVG